MIYAIIDKDIVINIIQAPSKYEDRLREIYPNNKVIECKRDKQGNTEGIGYYYSEKDKCFTPYKSWTIDANGKYKAKSEYPNDGKEYFWNEKTGKWGTKLVIKPI